MGIQERNKERDEHVEVIGVWNVGGKARDERTKGTSSGRHQKQRNDDLQKRRLSAPFARLVWRSNHG